MLNFSQFLHGAGHWFSPCNVNDDGPTVPSRLAVVPHGIFITYIFSLRITHRVALRAGLRMTEAAMSNDHERLVTALEPTLEKWNEWKRIGTLASQWPPDDGVVAPFVAAIEECEVFKPAQGRSLFSGNSGVILHAR